MTGTDADHDPHLLVFYARHPISARHIIDKLKAARGHLDDVAPQDLWPHDQDHYGGLTANERLAQRAGLQAGMNVADLCAGLGGPGARGRGLGDGRAAGRWLDGRRAEPGGVAARAGQAGCAE